MGLHLYLPCELFMIYIYLPPWENQEIYLVKSLSNFQNTQFPCPLSSSVTKNPDGDIFGTKKGIIDPLVSKRPGNKSEKMFLFIFQNKMSPRLPVIYIYLPVPWESQEINEMKDLGSSQKTFTSERFYDSERIFIKNQIKDLFNKKESIKTRKGQIAPLSFGSTS